MNKRLALIAFGFLAMPLFAQKAADVVVAQVNDRRGGAHFAQLSLDLELAKYRTTEVAASRVIVKTAVDNLGADLIDRERNDADLQANFRASADFKGWDKIPAATVSLQLKNPERKATTLKRLEGDIELFMPAKDPNSVAEIAKFVTITGKPLAHKALKANGVEISLLSAAQLEADKKRAADAKRKEYEGYGYEGENLETVVRDFLESNFGSTQGEIRARIKDPNKRIQEISWIDGKGEVKSVSKREEDGLTILSIWDGAPQPDWKMRVSMRTPKNLVRQSFALSDVPLP